MDLPPLEDDLYDRLRADIRLRGIQVPILVDNATGEVIDGRLRKQITSLVLLYTARTGITNMWRTASVFVLLLTASLAHAQSPSPWVGQKVVLKYQTPLELGGQVIEDDGQFRVFKVERADADRLLIESGSVGGWVRSADVVLFERAIGFYTDEIRADPEMAVAYRQRGAIWDEKKEYDKAIADFDKAIELDPEDPVAYSNRGNAWLGKKDPHKAIADYDVAIRLRPDYSSAFNSRGLAWDDLKDYDKAVADLDEAIRLNPNNEGAFNNRGLAWMHRKDFEKALADYGESIRLEPVQASAYGNRGNVRYSRREYDKALADYDEAIKNDPQNAVVYVSRGLCRRRQKDLDKAIADFDEAVKLDPKYANAFVSRGNTWSDKGDYGKAVADYHEAVRVNPESALGYINLGWLRATCPVGKFRDGKKAVELATRACDLNGGKGAAYHGVLAAAYAEAGDFEKAVEWQEKANYFDTDDDKKKGEERLNLFKEKKPYRAESGK